MSLFGEIFGVNPFHDVGQLQQLGYLGTLGAQQQQQQAYAGSAYMQALRAANRACPVMSPAPVVRVPNLAAGEKPDDPSTRWRRWSRRPDVVAESDGRVVGER